MKKSSPRRPVRFRPVRHRLKKHLQHLTVTTEIGELSPQTPAQEKEWGERLISNMSPYRIL